VAKKRKPVDRRKRNVQRRKHARRRVQARRRSDFYFELGKFGGLVAAVCLAVVGQAELIGEPWRHYVTVTAIIATAIWAYGTHPQTISTLWQTYKQIRSGKIVL